MKNVIFILFITILANASMIKFLGIESRYYTEDPKLNYKINAKYMLIDIDNIKKHYIFFNRKKIFERYNYIADGTFIYKHFKLSFKKSYQIGKKIYFINCSFKDKDIIIRSKECYTTLNNLDKYRCKNSRFYKKGKIIKTKIFYAINQ